NKMFASAVAAMAFLLTLSSPFSTLSASAKSTAGPTGKVEDENILRAQAEDYCKAFQAGDAAALANMWTPEGTYTDEFGQKFQGRYSIENLFSNYFKAFHGQPMKVKISSIRFPSKTVVLEGGTTTTRKGNEPISTNGYSVVQVKQDGKWLMFSATETAA